MKKRSKPQSAESRKKRRTDGLSTISFFSKPVREYEYLDSLLDCAFPEPTDKKFFKDACQELDALICRHEVSVKKNLPLESDPVLTISPDEMTEIEKTEIEKTEIEQDGDTPLSETEDAPNVLVDRFLQTKDNLVLTPVEPIRALPLEDYNSTKYTMDEITTEARKRKGSYNVTSVLFAVQMGASIEAIIMRLIAAKTQPEREAFLAKKRYNACPTFLNPYVVIGSEVYADACDKIGLSERYARRLLKVYNICKVEYGLEWQQLSHFFATVSSPSMDVLDKFTSGIIRHYHTHNLLRTREELGLPSYAELVHSLAES